MKRSLFLAGILFAGYLTPTNAIAQVVNPTPTPSAGTTLTTGEVAIIFYEDFGTPTGRTKAEHAASGLDAFIYGDSMFAYPLPKPAHESWATSDQLWINAAKLIENNHYTVVAPRNLYYSVPSFRDYLPSLTPGVAPGVGSLPGGWATWNEFVTYNDAPTLANPTGTADGGVMVVNAGLTRGILYDRDIALERGKYYKLTFSLLAYSSEWGNDVGLKVNFLNESKSIGLGSTPTITSSTQTRADRWKEQTVYFFLPADASCATTSTYHINLQNNVLATGGNDFAIDNIRLVEVTSVPSSAPATFTVNSPCASVPVAEDDAQIGFTVGSSATLNIINNDKLSDGVTTPILGNNATFHFLVPTGEGLNPYNNNELTIRGEGTWTVSNNGTVTFAPEPGFTGNPLPVEYTITENATGITSAPATVTISYDLPIVPYAADDVQLTANDGNKFVVNIFNNDTEDALATSPVQPSSSYVVQINHPLNEGVLYKTTDPNGIPAIEIAGEGTWTYSNGAFTFEPLSTFVGEPTLLEYRFQVPESNGNPAVWSNWAGVTLGAIGDPLSLDVLAFSVVAADKAALLKWTTTSKQLTRGFEIEKSTDGSTWSNIGFVASQSQYADSRTQEYSFTDNNTAIGKNLYRLKSINITGDYKYSPVRTLWFSTESNIAIFPNPANNNFNIVGLNGNESIYIYDVAGKLVIEERSTSNQANISLANLSEGAYHIHIIGQEGKVSIHKIVKIK